MTIDLSLSENRSAALQEIITLASRHQLSADEISVALRNAAGPSARMEQQKTVVSRLFSFIGGILMFSGVCVFISMFWDSFPPFFRVLITFGSGIALFVAAMACAKIPARSFLVTPLLLASALFQPGGMFVAFDEYGSGGDVRYAVLIVSGVMLFQYAVTFITVRREVLAWLAMLAGGFFFATAADLVEAPENLIMLALGMSYLLLATALENTLSVRHCGFWYMVGAVMTLSGFYDLVHASALEIAFPGLCALLVYLSIVVKSRSLLAISALALIWYIGDFAFDMFANNGLFPLGLIVAGGIFMGMGSLAMRLDRRFIRQQG